MTRRSGPRTARSGRREIGVGRYARLDRDRARRVGVPEVILGEGKDAGHLLGILRELHARGLGAIVSRPSEEQRGALGRSDLPLRPLAAGRLYRLAGPLGVRYRPGRVAVLAAGTSDVPLAEETVAVLREFGLQVVTAYDVGVAGLHRLLRAIRALERRRPQAYIVFAGREGALPTVVAGLVHAPVVGVPTAVGYGRGGRGEAALTAMLQSCAPLAVVNIDAAVPAALFVAQHFAAPLRSRRRPRPQVRARRRGRPVLPRTGPAKPK